MSEIVISQQLLERSQANERAFEELAWTASNYRNATEEQRARFDAWEESFDALDDDRREPAPETLQFKRLMEFASDVSQHASEFHDRTLAEMVQDLHRDLLEMSGDE